MKKHHFDVVLEELLKYTGPEAVKDRDAPVRRCQRYTENRHGQFDYHGALLAELPIGSGEIESRNRSVVQKRLTMPGAWWKTETAEHMLALRCVRINRDWKKYWKCITSSFLMPPYTFNYTLVVQKMHLYYAALP